MKNITDTKKMVSGKHTGTFFDKNGLDRIYNA